MPTMDPSVSADYARIDAEREASTEAARDTQTNTPDHRKVWKSGMAPLTQATAKTALAQPVQHAPEASQQMQAEEHEQEGDLFMQWGSGRSNN